MAKRNQKRAKPKRKRSGRRWVWACGTVPVPGRVMDGDESYQPTMSVVMGRAENVVLATELVEPGVDAAEAMAVAIKQAMEAPLVGPARRPDKIFVRDPELIPVLSAITGAVVVRGATPELDMVTRSLHDHMARAEGPVGPAESYFEGGRVSPLSVGRMFDGAAALFRCTPWEHVDPDSPIRIDAPALGLEGACAVVMGHLGDTHGFLLFPSIEGFAALGERDPHDPTAPDLGPWFISLELVLGAVLAPRARKEVVRHGWRVEGPEAYPWVTRHRPDGSPQQGTDESMRFVGVVAEAIARLVETHGDLRGVQPGGGPLTWKGRIEGVEVEASTPFGVEAGMDSAAFHHAMDRDIVAGLGAWASDVMPDAYWKHLRAFEDADDVEGLAASWSVYDCPIDGLTVAEHFLASGESQLNGVAREWLDAQAEAWLSVWEATEVVPGEAMTLTDLLTGERRRVAEKQASEGLPERTCFLARVTSAGDHSLLTGTHPCPLGPHDSEVVLDEVRRRLRRKSQAPVDRLRPLPIQRAMIKAWEAQVGVADARRTLPPKLHNTDGDPVLMTVDRFTFDPSARSRIRAAMAAMEGVEEPSDGEPEGDFTLTRPGNAMHPTWGTTVVARLHLGAARLEVDTNSVQRADHTRALITAALGDLIRFEIRTHVDPTSPGVMGGPRKQQTYSAEERKVLAAAVVDMKTQQYASWLDQPVPALGDRTPRQAARTKKGRKAVDLLLRELELMESRIPADERFDVRRLREELGV